MSIPWFCSLFCLKNSAFCVYLYKLLYSLILRRLCLLKNILMTQKHSHPKMAASTQHSKILLQLLPHGTNSYYMYSLKWQTWRILSSTEEVIFRVFHNKFFSIEWWCTLAMMMMTKLTVIVLLFCNNRILPSCNEKQWYIWEAVHVNFSLCISMVKYLHMSYKSALP